MVEIVFLKRNCKLNVLFFQFLIRKLPATKNIIIQACNNVSKKGKLRPAQLKQLNKLKSKITKKAKQVKK